ncbi:potassium channel subfamily K member 1 [Platysternon megacephalum]|uniref:Potassium channel subfamily K member 1 n=1 Tax=Platysternon megacephalum TaxID=55544 RepID=A0A4D9ET26_9SAUR|nr:potassium channel subfamily K member 1 [Platysternon megacephalum]
MERRLAQFRAARRAPQPPAAPASEQRAGPEAGLGPRDRPAQEEARRPGPPQDVAAGAAAPWGARALLTQVALLKFLLWLVLLGLAAELQFGLPCFVLSLFYWLYAGMRGPRERRPGERSAYSVFNPGCQAIQGTLTAEQLERELHYGPAAGR